MTGLIALALSKNLGWDSVTTKSKLIMASVLQDITLTDDSLTQISELGDEALNGQTALNIAEFVAHPTKAAELAIQFTKYPDLDFLIKNHHELPNKMGFPNKPSSLSLTVLCSVFNISQHIAAKLDDNDITNELIDSLLKSMLRNFNAANFKEPMKIAKKIMKV